LLFIKNIPLDEATNIVNTFFETIKDSLKKGNRVQIRGFGSFKVKHYNSYVGRNPNTGEQITVRPKSLPFFKIGKELKDYLNE